MSCQFCDPDVRKRLAFVDDKVKMLIDHEGDLKFSGHGEYSFFKINFCPLCGKELEDI